MLLERSIIRFNGPSSKLALSVGGDAKGRASLLLYLPAVGMAFVRPAVSITLYVFVPLLWFVPDRRIESLL
jgi:hypothetical protein